MGRVLGNIDLAAIPIGSYEPRWHMHLQHTDPEGAVNMAKFMNVKKSVGVHWGTWIMSDELCKCLPSCFSVAFEPRPGGLLRLLIDNQPPKDLALAREKLDVSEEMFSVEPVGRTIVID